MTNVYNRDDLPVQYRLNLSGNDFLDWLDEGEGQESRIAHYQDMQFAKGIELGRSEAREQLFFHFANPDLSDEDLNNLVLPQSGFRQIDGGDGTVAVDPVVASNPGTSADDFVYIPPEEPTAPFRSLVFQEEEGDIPWSKTYKDKVNYFGGIASSVIDAGNPNLWRVTYGEGFTELMNWNPLNRPERAVNNAASEDAQLQDMQQPPGDAQVDADKPPTTGEVITQAQIDAANAEEARLAAERAKEQADREEEDRRNAQAEADNAAQQARLQEEIDLALWVPYTSGETGEEEIRYRKPTTGETISAAEYQELVDAFERAKAVDEENVIAAEQVDTSNRNNAREIAADPLGVSAPVVNGETYEWFYDSNGELTVHWTDIQNRSIPGLGFLPRHEPTEAQINRGEPGTLIDLPTDIQRTTLGVQISGYPWTSDPEKWTEAQLSLLQGRPIREGGNWIKADGVLNSFLDQTFNIPSITIALMTDGEIKDQIQRTLNGGQIKLIDILGIMFFPAQGIEGSNQRKAWWDLHERGEGIPEELWVKIFRPSYYENPITIDEIDYLSNWLANVHTAETKRLTDGGERDVAPRVQPSMQPPNADGSAKPITDGILAVDPYELPLGTYTPSVSMDDTISLFMNAGKGMEGFSAELQGILQTNIGLPETFDLGSHIGFGTDAATVAEGQAAIARIETAEDALGALDVDVANLVHDDIPGLEAKLSAVSAWLGTVEVPDFDVQPVINQIGLIRDSLQGISTGSAMVQLEGLQMEIDQAFGAVTRLNAAVSTSVTSLSTNIGITKDQIDTIIGSLSDVGLDKKLTDQIKALISEDPNISDIESLKGKLGELQTEGGEYLGALVDKIADTSRAVSNINAVLDGLEVPTELQNTITNMLYMQGSDLNILRDNLKGLGINPILELQIENRLSETQTLQSALTSLNVNTGLSTSIQNLTKGDLLKLQNALSSNNLKLPDTLQQSIVDRTNEINNLKEALNELPDVSSALQNDIVKLMGNGEWWDIAEYGGGGLLGAVTRAVEDLEVPQAFMNRLSIEIGRVKDLQKAMDALPTNTSLGVLSTNIYLKQQSVDSLDTLVKGLKLGDTFSDNVSDLLDDSKVIDATLKRLMVPLSVRMQVNDFVKEGGTLDDLESTLKELKVGDALTNSIVEATSKVTLLAGKLVALDVGTQDGWVKDAQNRWSYVPGEGPPLDKLLTDLTVLLSDDESTSDIAKLKGKLSGMGDSWDTLSGDLQEKLATSLANANLLGIALGGLGDKLDDGIMTELSNLLSDEPDVSNIAKLEKELLDLKVNPALAGQITDRIAQADLLRDSLKDLNVAGLQQEINLTQWEADSLKNVLDLMKVRPELELEIDAAAKSAGALDGLVSALSVNAGLTGEFLQANIKVNALTSALGKLSISTLSPGLEDDFTESFAGARDLSKVLKGLKIDNMLNQTLTAYEGRALRLDSLLLSLSDKIDPELSNNIQTQMDEVGDLGKVLTSLQIPTPLAQNILLADAQASNLKFDLEALDVPDTLRQQIVDETIRVGDLSKALFSLNLDTANPGLTQDILLRTSQVETLDGLLGRLEVPDALYGQIKSGIKLGENLESVLSKLDIDPLLSGELITEYANVTRLDGLLKRLDIPSHLAGSIQTQLAISGNLKTTLDELRLDKSLKRDIGLRFVDALKLEAKIESLNDIGAIGTLQIDLEKIMRDGGDLDQILTLLPTLEVPTALSGLLTGRLNQARTLENSLAILGTRGIAISDTVRDDLQENIDILGSAVDENSLIYILENLGVPESFSEKLGFMMTDANNLELALERAKGLGYAVTEDIKDAVRDNLDKLIGVGVDFGDEEATDSLIGRLGEIGLDPAILIGLTTALEQVQEIDALLTPLRQRLGKEIIKPIQDAFDAITGGDDPTTSLMNQLDSLGFTTDTVDDITELWEDVGKLKGIMKDVGVRTEVQTQVSTLLSMGEDLAAVLTSLGVEDEDKQAILDAARGVEGLTENLSQAETIFDRLAEEIPSKLGELSTSLETFGADISTVTEQVTEAAVTGQAALSEYERLTSLIMSRLENFEAPVLGADLQRALSRPQMAAIEDLLQAEIEKIVGEIGFDPAEYKRVRTATINRNFDNAKEALGRQFGITPAGQLQGQAMRRWELLETQKAIELNDLQVEIMDRERETQLETLNTYTNTLAAISQSTIQQQELAQRTSEFTQEMQLKLKDFGLTQIQAEAAVRQIDSAILNRTRELSNEIAATWASLTGEVGFAPGVIDLGMLGVDSTVMDIPFLPGLEGPERAAALASDEANTIRLSFSALVGREPTEAEMEALLSGASVEVDSMPTQQAREFAVTVMMQNMERVAKYAAIAEEHEFDSAQFEDAVTRLDKEWNLKTLQIGGENGLDEATFRDAKFRLDNRLNRIFFNDSLSSAERAEQEALALDEISDEFGEELKMNFITANDQFNIAYGNIRDQVAVAKGIDAEKFEMAMRQAQAQEDRFLATWSGIVEGADRTTKDLKSSEQVGEYLRRFHAILKPAFDEAGLERADIERDPETAINDFMRTADQEDIDYLTTLMEDLNPNLSFPKDEVRKNLVSTVYTIYVGKHKDHVGYLRRVWEESFDWTPWVKDRSEEREARDPWLDNQEEYRSVMLTGVDDAWFGKLSDDEREALLLVLNGSNLSPERTQGTSWLSSLGSAIGIGAGALIGGKIAGPPGAKAGAGIGGAIGSAVTGG